MKMTQNDAVIWYINKFGSITSLEAQLELGVMRLASRICDLTRKGYKFTKTRETVPTRYNGKTHITRYRLQEDQEDGQRENL